MLIYLILASVGIRRFVQTGLKIVVSTHEFNFSNGLKLVLFYFLILIIGYEGWIYSIFRKYLLPEEKVKKCH